ncbi:MAG TPA: hypothetical protein VMZ90_01160, partial [Vicinamibacterales bacterium]|nr:hypothetical protein [Vicinamibacterales bacterium]
TRTFAKEMSITSGTDRVDLYHFGPGHTGGDAVVVFPSLRTAHVGDLFAGKALPVIDVFHGGSGIQLPETLAKVHDGVKDVDQIITGHGRLFGWNDLADYADFNKEFLAWAVEQRKVGRSAEAAAGAYRLPAKYVDYKMQPWDVRTNIERIYAELDKPATPATRWRGGVE